MPKTPEVRENDIEPVDRLIFALDVPDAERARALIRELGDSVTFYKLGLELFLSGAYFDLVDELKAAGKKVFADLKLFDVPATVGRATAQLARQNVDFLTVHGQDAMLAAAAENKGGARVLAVTALTSLDQGDLDDLGFDCNVADLVLSRARRALTLGCDGVISSGLEVPALRQGVDPALVVVCPGIRPVANVEVTKVDDQKRTMSVSEAFSAGADHIVVGRPIRDADNPAAAAAAMQATIKAIFNDTKQ